MTEPKNRGIRITYDIEAPTEEIRQQARREVRAALTAAGFGPTPKPTLRVIRGGQ